YVRPPVAVVSVIVEGKRVHMWRCAVGKQIWQEIRVERATLREPVIKGKAAVHDRRIRVCSFYGWIDCREHLGILIRVHAPAPLVVRAARRVWLIPEFPVMHTISGLTVSCRHRPHELSHI